MVKRGVLERRINQGKGKKIQMRQRVFLAILILTLLLGVGCKTQEIPETTSVSLAELNHAKPYSVLGEGNIANEKEDRTVGLWFIVAEDATSYEEWAQTAIQAVRDLYLLYGRDYTSVLLIPNDKLEYAINYAVASYAADGKGALGMTGSAPAKEMYWRVYATNHPCTDQELAIAALWFEKMQDFPSTNPFSSLSYDEKALKQYIADTLGITYDEAVLPIIDYQDYEYDERL
jgi:hypothetical protein